MISDKVYFRGKNIVMNKEAYFIVIKGSVSSWEDKMILNIPVPNNRASNYMYITKKTDKFTKILHASPIINRIGRQKFKRYEICATLPKQFEVTNVYRTHWSTIKMHLISEEQEMFTKVGNSLGERL